MLRDITGSYAQSMRVASWFGPLSPKRSSLKLLCTDTGMSFPTVGKVMQTPDLVGLGD